MDVKKFMFDIFASKKTQLSFAGAALFGAGAVTGYFTARGELSMKFQEEFDKHSAEMREHYLAKTASAANDIAKEALGRIEEKRLKDELEKAALDATTPEHIALAKAEAAKSAVEAQKDLDEAHQLIEYSKFSKDEQLAIAEVNNIWKDSTVMEFTEEEDEEAEPFIIKREQFDEEDEYSKSHLTYYEKDGVLCGERDQILENSEDFIGPDSNLKWGFKSKDNNVVFIRNPFLMSDMEVVRSFGSYDHEVLGVLEHSDKPRGVRKFRELE